MIADATRMQRQNRVIFAFVFLLLMSTVARAQVATHYPTELYSGENIITIKAPNGIRSIEAVFDSMTASLTEIHGMGGVGDLGGCPDSHKVQIRVNTATVGLNVRFRVTDCRNNTTVLVCTNRTWRLDEVPFPDAEVGDTICRPFQIGLAGFGGIGTTEYLDSISVMTPDGYATYSFPPPLQLTSGSNYRYNVCFIAKKPGVYRFPVITWMRRAQPADGYTNYAVADTGVVRVVRKLRPDFTEVPLDTASEKNFVPEEPVTDPTTFRTIAVPNAVIPPKGKAFIGSYDVLGLTAGYAVADELLLFVGGAPPLPDDWGGVNGDMFWAFGAGAKLGTELFENFNIAGGYAFAMSTLDKEFTVDELDSRIRLHIPYAALSYGTDDRRVSATAGLAFKRHSTWILADPFFGDYRKDYDTTAVFGSIGGDYRFAKHWKVAVEGAYMQTLDVVPVMLTARYFTNSMALELGAGYAGFTLNNAEAPKIPIFPVLSAIFVF